MSSYHADLFPSNARQSRNHLFRPTLVWAPNWAIVFLRFPVLSRSTDPPPRPWIACEFALIDLDSGRAFPGPPLSAGAKSSRRSLSRVSRSWAPRLLIGTCAHHSARQYGRRRPRRGIRSATPPASSPSAIPCRRGWTRTHGHRSMRSVCLAARLPTVTVVIAASRVGWFAYFGCLHPIARRTTLKGRPDGHPAKIRQVEFAVRCRM